MPPPQGLTCLRCRVTPGFGDGSVGKESACKAGDPGSNPGLGRTPGGGNSYPLQYSDLENSMDCIVRGVPKRLSNFHLLGDFTKDGSHLMKTDSQTQNKGWVLEGGGR